MRTYTYILSVLAFCLVANTVLATYPAPMAPMPEPVKIVKQGLEKLQSIGQAAEQKNPTALAEQLSKEIAPYFDFGYMANWVAGPMKRRMSEQKLQALAGQIRGKFLTTLAEKLSADKGYKFQILPLGGNFRTGEIQVSVGVIQANNQPMMRIRFRLYLSAEGWKVFDVMANGSSAVAHYRREFMQQMMPRFPHPQRFMRHHPAPAYR